MPERHARSPTTLFNPRWFQHTIRRICYGPIYTDGGHFSTRAHRTARPVAVLHIMQCTGLISAVEQADAKVTGANVCLAPTKSGSEYWLIMSLYFSTKSTLLIGLFFLTSEVSVKQILSTNHVHSANSDCIL